MHLTLSDSPSNIVDVFQKQILLEEQMASHILGT